MHIRRGDYCISNWEISDMSYYNMAMTAIESQIQNPKYFIFSDDPEWCKNIFKDDKYKIVDNNNSKGYIDLYLMSKCKNNIIANSTFSYWGAILNDTKSKIVISPKYLATGVLSEISLPNDWIKLNL